MGKGGRMSVQPVSNNEEQTNESIVRRVPHQKPPFTIADIKKAIPPHCFNRSLIRSSSYLVFDIAVCFLLYYIATNYISLLPAPLSYVAWTAYVYVQGCFMFAIWVVAHECGHHGFSDYHLLNDTLGFILHSLLLVPYFSWKISHRRHHANTNSLDRDENHVPRFKNTIRSYYHHFNNPVGRVFIIAFTLTLGWPLYLIVNIAGRSYDRFASHFDPYSPIYSERERAQIMLSDLGFVAACYGLYRIAAVKGFAWVFLVYGAPLHVVNGFLVMITLLHHTHLSLPHYDSSEWDWLRGALATVDRDYGILNKVFHHIADTHVLHHLISSIPHYHAQEATEAIKPVLGEYYHYDGTPFYKAMWREAKECLYVEEEDEGDNKTKGVYWPEELRVPFERFGVVRDVYLPKDYYTGEPRGFAFVQFLDPYEAAEAQYRMNGQLFAGREISVVVAAETRKRPDDMRRRTRTGRGPSGYEGQSSSYYGRSRSRSRSRSPRYPSGSRSRHHSRSYSPAPRRRSDYSLSSERKKGPRSPRDPPAEGDGRHARRSYSPSSGNDAADRNGKDYADRPAYDSDGAGTHWKSSPGRAIRSPSGSRSRSADISPRQSR